MGLSIVKSIVEHHGGQITVHSKLGHGSIFMVWFPLGGEKA
ncbi:ATP-binding protein [Paenibacillus larvae]|uniref:histidine kinase n=1 Tax=Paenibacillus larvae TaxID=1464 RepID=A0AAP5JXN4_9BACL|nr:ATP-binding protein [Paenibacillus larvae]MDE5124735.1 ATP-binding protein [Paenibacillus larvae subsp. larvae]MDE5133505.1 ATP-binding protein [Paenibacillus larvae subsp. larvae]MDE5137007.1 ATP-binding protein [Paenibacillus larvae subsp. larvae]MDE5140536.1 ATP-binding protein [Paenibacillus larvae subsp. larvae]MDE5148395.1 ATP-binding protein [Paenibacillus larvae subsp. larvae]